MSRPISAVVVSAPSGAGKSTVLGRVLREVSGLRFSVSHTTRGPRPGEREGVDYHFVDRAAFDAMMAAGAFLEWADVHGHRYGTALAEYDQAAADGLDLLLDLDVQGAAQVRLKLRDALTVFLLPPTYAALETRLRGRGSQDEDDIRRRLSVAREEIGLYAEFDYVIVNEDLDECVQNLESVIRAARCRTRVAGDTARRIISTFPPCPEEPFDGASDPT